MNAKEGRARARARAPLRELIVYILMKRQIIGRRRPQRAFENMFCDRLRKTLAPKFVFAGVNHFRFLFRSSDTFAHVNGKFLLAVLLSKKTEARRARQCMGQPPSYF